MFSPQRRGWKSIDWSSLNSLSGEFRVLKKYILMSDEVRRERERARILMIFSFPQADGGRLSLYVYALSSLLCECMCVWLISFFFSLSIFVLFWWNVLFDVIVRVWVRWWMGNNFEFVYLFLMIYIYIIIIIIDAKNYWSLPLNSLSHWEARVCEYMCNLSFNSGLGFNVCTLY